MQKHRYFRVKRGGNGGLLKKVIYGVLKNFRSENKRQNKSVPADESGIMLNFVFAVRPVFFRATMQIMKQVVD